MARILVVLIAPAALLHADTLVLRNGNRIEGTFIDGGNHSIRFAVASQINSYSLTDIESIHFGSGPPADAAPQPTSSLQAGYPAVTPPNPPPNHAPDTSAAPISAAPTTARLEIPAGAQIVVRLIDDVNSERDRVGATYRVSVDEPVIVNGQTAIPRDADATAALIDAQQSGKIEGRTILTLDLKYVAINGHTYDLVTTGVPQASTSRGARSAKVIGSAAALGAIIGAAAGGGKGAAIGAGAGAAAGTAAQVATSGQKVKIPAETRLTFTLKNPLDL